MTKNGVKSTEKIVISLVGTRPNKNKANRKIEFSLGWC